MSKKGLSVFGQDAISPQDAAFLGARPEISSQQFLRAVLEDQLEEAAKMIVHDDRLVRSRDASGASALLLAVYHGLDEMAGLIRRSEVPLDFAEAVAVADLPRVRQLLDENPALLGEPTPDGFTGLVLAAWLGHGELVAELLERGADPGQPSSNATGMTPLHAAASCRSSGESLAIARLLVDRGAPLEAALAGGFTPLHLASAQGKKELVELLLERGADPMAASDTDATALELAAERGFNDIVRLLERHAASLA